MSVPSSPRASLTASGRGATYVGSHERHGSAPYRRHAQGVEEWLGLGHVRRVPQAVRPECLVDSMPRGSRSGQASVIKIC